VVQVVQVVQTNDIVKFQLHDKYLIVVPAMVNGAGPFNFLLDTGTTRTVIDPALARQLQAPVIGESTLTTVSAVRQVHLVQLHEVRVGLASVPGLGAVVDKLDEEKLLAPGIRGVLGEDFLSIFDILIDYQKRVLRFDEPAPAGERCRIETMGKSHGLPTSNRLLIEVAFMEVNGGKVQLQLDTGAKTPELFPAGDNTFSPHPWGDSMAFSNGPNGITIHTRVTIKIGSTFVRDLDVVQSRHGIAFDAVGLLPASIFHRIYISHSGGFVVLNPVE
jgi:predicted aspartyl protease